MTAFNESPRPSLLILPEEYRDWVTESDVNGEQGGAQRSPNKNQTGIRITPENSMRATVVLACVRVLSASVASLPLHVYERLTTGGKQAAPMHPLYSVLHDFPNDLQTSYEWRETLMLHLLLWGNAYCEIQGSGAFTQLVILHPSRMKVEPISDREVRYVFTEANGGKTTYHQGMILHLRWMSDDGINGMVPSEIAEDAIALARACEIQGGAYFGRGSRPGVVLQTEAELKPETITTTRNMWDERHGGPGKRYRTAILQGGLKMMDGGGTNQESQFLETRRFQIEEICRIFGVPPHLVSDLSRSSFSNIEQQSLDYLYNGLLPWLRRFESAFRRTLFARNERRYFVEFDTRGALRMDAVSRSNYYRTMNMMGVFTINQILDWENLPRVDGGDTRFVPLNMQTLEHANASAAVAMQQVSGDPSASVGDIVDIVDIIAKVAAGQMDIPNGTAAIVALVPSVDPSVVQTALGGVMPTGTGTTADGGVAA